mgnify:CR=1 FL=1
MTGNVTGNTSGTAATVTTAAQSAITSLGTLTGLTVSGATTTNVLKGGTTNFDIYQTTSDGSDNRRTRIGGGGDVSQSRGAFIELTGNEHSDTGDLILNAGDISGGDILFKTDNTTRVFVARDGKVGIGDISPDYLLDVESTTAWGAIIELNQKSDGTEGAQLFLKHQSASPADEDYLGFVNFKGMNDAGQEVQYARIDGISADVTDGNEDGRLVFNTAVAGTANTLTMALTGGNVGIGVTSPTARLQVSGANANTEHVVITGS